jgi:LEA14-like dessication related protein
MINNLDFGDIAISKKKDMVLKIANPNPIPITFEDVVKGQLDEVGIDLVKILNR